MDTTALRKAFEQIRDEKITHANTATRIGNAFLSLLGFVSNLDLDQYLSSVNDDEAEGLITFLKGIALGESGSYTLSPDGKAILSQIIADSIKSSDFVTETAGAGFSLANGSGGSKLEVDYLLVRKLATFIELEIRKLSYVGGNIFLSKSGSTIESVEEVYDTDEVTLIGWKCVWTNDDGTTATTNEWRVYDQARCQTFNIGDNGNRYYWRLVTEVGDNYVVLSAKDYDGMDTDGGAANTNAQSIPKAGDVIVQAGYRYPTLVSDGVERTNVVQMNTSGDDAPCIKMYKGITGYSFPKENLVTLISPNGVYFNTDYFQLLHDGVSMPVEVYRGDWSSSYNDGNGYAYYDTVTHDGCLWICGNPNGGVTSEPREDSSDWKLKSGTPTKYEMALDLGGFEYCGLAVGESFTATCTITKGNKDLTDQVSAWKVERDSGDSDADAIWNAAHTDFAGSVTISYSDLGSSRVTTFTFTASIGDNTSTASLEI